MMQQLNESLQLFSIKFANLRIANILDDFLVKELDAQNFEFEEIREDAFELPSSFIGKVTWFNDQTMVIQISSKNFNYCGVSREDFIRFRNSGSKGKFFNDNFRGIKECRN